MAKKRVIAKKGGPKKAAPKPTKSDNPKKTITLTQKQVAAWQLLTCGYTSEVVGQMVGVHPVTVREWKQKIVREMADMPTVRAAIDRTMTMIPKALSVVDKAMDGIDKKVPGARPVAYQAAKDVLTANRIFTDRMAVSDDRNKPDSELVAEAERIMAQAKGKIKDDIGHATGDD